MATKVLPPDINEGDRADVLLPKFGAALRLSNKRIDATHDCQVRQRESFARGK